MDEATTTKRSDPDMVTYGPCRCGQPRGTIATTSEVDGRQVTRLAIYCLVCGEED